MSKFNDAILRILNEQNGRTHISVDVQMEYSQNIGFDVEDYYLWMLDNFDEVIVYVNGPELGFGTIEDHKEWLESVGVPYEIYESGKFDFREKGYAFFRSCMDEGYEECLSDVIRFMFQNDITDSRDLTDDHKHAIIGEYGEGCVGLVDWLIENEDPIIIPELMDELKNDQLRRVSVSGGGDYECLEEIRLALTALDVEHEDVRQWIY